MFRMSARETSSAIVMFLDSGFPGVLTYPHSAATGIYLFPFALARHTSVSGLVPGDVIHTSIAAPNLGFIKWKITFTDSAFM